MPNYASPLRYPGGKTALYPFLAGVIAANDLWDCHYAEPFAGGAGAALSLLLRERVSRVLLNDVDYCVYAFWKSAIEQQTRFLRLLEEVPIDMDEWHRQHHVYSHPRSHSRLRVGFATFFLNRCNRSGIIASGGPIGGYEQSGRWQLSARFNRASLRKRIERLGAYKERIEVYNMDAVQFLKHMVQPVHLSGSIE